MNLFPNIKVPYYIISPSYTHTSSGVRTLHLLCHALNEAGEKAFLVPAKPYQPGNFTCHPHLNTPVISIRNEYINFYGDNGIDPIFVYPDIVDGNPFHANKVVRMYLGEIGAYGRIVTPHEPSDQIWGALPSIAENVLRVPVADPSIFYEPTGGKRGGTCFYSHKYNNIGSNKLLPLTKNSTSLVGTLEDLASILRSSEMCYLYELSSVITEAALCGCPVTLIRTPFFNTIDKSCMMGQVCWSDGELVKQCDDYLPEYQNFIDDFPVQLENFIRKTQTL